MRKRIYLIAVACFLVGAAPAQAAVHTNDPIGPYCGSREFRIEAKEVYRPWMQPRGNKSFLRRLKHCAVSKRARRQMNRIEGKLVYHRTRIRKAFAYYTPYGPYAIPGYIVACESGGSWSAYNPSGAAGIYQLMPEWGRPFPVRTWKDKLTHHRIAYDLYAGGAGASNWVCA
jgi:hypothetical protein